jgi:hypothetical protein
VWEDWYGWTWVSADPWGWAPYHYGRWFHHDRFGWCWYPGAFGPRHYWSPALVGWFGFGGGGGFGFGFGNIGWVPLAPFEVLHPWWGRGFYGRGFNRTTINVTNINVTNVYRNARFHNGVSAVGVHDFQNGRFNNIARINGSTIREAGAVRGAMPFTPTADHLRFTDRQAAVVPRNMGNTHFFTHQTPAAVTRMPIGRMGAMPSGGQGLPQTPVRGGDNGAGFRRFGAPAGQGQTPQVNAPRVERNGFGGNGQSPVMRNNDRPMQTPQGNQPAGPRNNDRGGWNRFGSPGNSGGSPAAPPRQDFRQNQQAMPQNNNNDRPRFNDPNRGGANRQEPLRIAPQVMRERPSQPQYQAPRQSAPQYQAPRQSAPSNPAPRQSPPSFSAPRGNGGGGNGGGGGHSNGGGGGHSNGGGGGGHSGGGGGHGGGRR